MCGLKRPNAGRVSVFGIDVVRDAIAARYLIGLVPQELNFDPFVTTRRALLYQMGYYGQRPDRRRVDEIIEAMGLADKADTITSTLSGGMLRRLLVAKALIHRPRVAFLDEPTAGVDLPLRRDLWAYVRKLRGEGMTIVLTTHYLEEAETLADRVGVLDRGALIANDHPQALIDQHGGKGVRFTLRDPIVESSLPAALREAGARLEADGRQVICPMTDRGIPDVLAALLSVPGARVEEIHTEKASLEQVFLALTGSGK